MFSGKIYKLILVSFFVCSISVDTAHAYTCWGWTPDQARTVKRDADSVFIGKITNISTVDSNEDTIGDHKFSIKFTAKAIWKGDVNRKTIIVDVDSAYKYDFQLNGMYLVYGYKIHNDDTISVVGCPRVKLLGNSVKEVGHLGEALYPLDFKIGDLGEYVDGDKIIVEVIKQSEKDSEDSNGNIENEVDKDIDLPIEVDNNMEVEMNSEDAAIDSKDNNMTDIILDDSKEEVGAVGEEENKISPDISVKSSELK